jgi:predicted ribosome quality control (RQC) complex YloA/Tae2 family protein
VKRNGSKSSFGSLAQKDISFLGMFFPLYLYIFCLFGRCIVTLSNLVCSARDALQTELLIRKYFRKGDIYVHSDLQNSCVVVIKNPVEDGAIPPGTLAQAGIMSVATSRAWEVKQGTTTH